MSDLAIGLMSGTSCDGISAALIRFQANRVSVIAERTTPYPKAIAQRLKLGGSLSARQLSSLNMELGELLAQAAKRILQTAKIAAARVTVIGSHGHTVYHGPKDAVASTLQIGEPVVIAQRTGITVVADFRPGDIAVGGQGAPLVPFFDAYVFGGGPARALQNIGGIANVTFVGRGIATQAFDTGPGNCLIDTAASIATRGRMRFDASGHLALRGRIDSHAIERLWRQPYFRQAPPKSTGRELFNESLLQQIFGAKLKQQPLDRLATVTYFTAFSIAESYRRFFSKRISEVIVSGGGVRNCTLMWHLSRLLTPIPVHSIERYGIPLQAKEPAAFALLALRAIRGKINHLPQTTGARKACILGAIYKQ